VPSPDPPQHPIGPAASQSPGVESSLLEPLGESRLRDTLKAFLDGLPPETSYHERKALFERYASLVLANPTDLEAALAGEVDIITSAYFPAEVYNLKPLLKELSEKANKDYAVETKGPTRATQPTSIKQFILQLNGRLLEALDDHATLEELAALHNEYLASRIDKLDKPDTAGLLARLALTSVQIDRLRLDLDETVDQVRAAGATWTDIGAATRISQQAAHRKWDPDARKKHSDYERQRKRG